MQIRTNIILIGYRGTGKSTIGRVLADRLGRVLVDTDTMIVQRAGQTIRDIFAARGEAGFRDLEAAVIADLALRQGLVIAAGGGVVLRPANVENLKRHGTLIWLQADPEILHQRIHADAATTATRPNLTAGGGMEEIRTLLAQRTPLYQAAADHTLDVAALTPEAAADAILHLLSSAGL